MMVDQLDEFTLREGVMRPEDILQSATAVNAEIMGLEGEIGAIVPGAFADLIVVDGDPLDGLAILKNANRMFAVMKGGKFHLNRLS